MNPDRISTYLRYSAPPHDAYTVRFFDRRLAATVTARPAAVRRWVHTTRWLHCGHLHSAGLVAGLGVQWTPPRRALLHRLPEPATVQICVGHRVLLFQISRATAVPEALRRFLADDRITFVGSGFRSDCEKLRAHYGLVVADGRELRSMAGMGNASMELMAEHYLGYAGVKKPTEVAMSAWHARELTVEQVQYACVDAYVACRLGVCIGPNRFAAPRSAHCYAVGVGDARAHDFSNSSGDGDDDSEYEDGAVHRVPFSMSSRTYYNETDDFEHCISGQIGGDSVGEYCEEGSVGIFLSIEDLPAEFEHPRYGGAFPIIEEEDEEKEEEEYDDGGDDYGWFFV